MVRAGTCGDMLHPSDDMLKNGGRVNGKSTLTRALTSSDAALHVYISVGGELGAKFREVCLRFG